MYVTPSKLCKTRDWWPSVKHLEGKRMKVVKEFHSLNGYIIIQFIDSTGKMRNWKTTNLTLVKSIQLENK